jgi:hypothetical protein
MEEHEQEVYGGARVWVRRQTGEMRDPVSSAISPHLAMSIVDSRQKAHTAGSRHDSAAAPVTALCPSEL